MVMLVLVVFAMLCYALEGMSLCVALRDMTLRLRSENFDLIFFRFYIYISLSLSQSNALLALALSF